MRPSSEHRRTPATAAARVAIAVAALAIGVATALTYPPATLSQLAGGVDVDAVLRGPAGRCLGLGEGETRSCLLRYVSARTRADGAEAALADLEVLSARDAAARGFCHALAHETGHAGYEKYGEIGAAFRHGASTCWSGYYHGVLEAYAESAERPALEERVNVICDGVTDADGSGHDRFNCVHGLGHGLLAYAQDDLDAALALCDRLQSDGERDACHAGAFMQNVINEDFTGHKASFRTDDPDFPCDAVDETYRRVCYNRQTTHLLRVFGGDFTRVFAACGALGDQVLADACALGLGRDAAAFAVGDIRRTRDHCLKGGDVRQREACFVGAARFLSFYESEGKARRFCDLLRDKDERAACLETVEEHMAPFTWWNAS
ncbi:MAG TPA: hypothetical protein VL283_00840 [Candidatus Baltobacteraceae bacterium]|nr:hypothetical protein [Candidatus Baltobacteraceae bacterium]